MEIFKAVVQWIVNVLVILFIGAVLQYQYDAASIREMKAEVEYFHNDAQRAYLARDACEMKQKEVIK